MSEERNMTDGTPAATGGVRTRDGARRIERGVSGLRHSGLNADRMDAA